MRASSLPPPPPPGGFLHMLYAAARGDAPFDAAKLEPEFRRAVADERDPDVVRDLLGVWKHLCEESHVRGLRRHRHDPH